MNESLCCRNRSFPFKQLLHLALTNRSEGTSATKPGGHAKSISASAAAWRTCRCLCFKAGDAVVTSTGSPTVPTNSMVALCLRGDAGPATDCAKDPLSRGSAGSISSASLCIVRLPSCIEVANGEASCPRASPLPNCSNSDVESALCCSTSVWRNVFASMADTARVDCSNVFRAERCRGCSAESRDVWQRFLASANESRSSTSTSATLAREPIRCTACLSPSIGVSAMWRCMHRFSGGGGKSECDTLGNDVHAPDGAAVAFSLCLKKDLALSCKSWRECAESRCASPRAAAAAPLKCCRSL